jgi:hypothetical protein
VWWGGFTAGPRFLIPALVLFGPLIGIGLGHFPRIGFVLLTLSVVNYFAITTVAILVDELVASPLSQVIYPHLLWGRFQRSNIGTFLGLEPLWSILPVAAVLLLLLAICYRHTFSGEREAVSELHRRLP